MASDKEREFCGIVEGLDEPDISAASYIPKQCYAARERPSCAAG